MDQIRREITYISNKDLSAATINDMLIEELVQEPRNWVIIDSLELIASNAALTLEPETTAALEAAKEQDQSLLALGRECASCMWSADNCELSIAMACGLAVNLTPIADITGLTRAGIAHSQGNEIDQVDVLLSIIGLSVTAISLVAARSPATIKSGATIKAGAGFLKFAHTTGQLPPAISRILVNAAREGIHWHRLKNVRSIDDLEQVKNMRALEPAVEAISDIGTLLSDTNPTQALYLISQSDNVTELQRTTKVSQILGTETAGYFRIFGKSRILRTTFKFTDGVLGVLLGLAGLMSSIILGYLQRKTTRWAIRQ
ncbi:hypothetical protein BVC71_09410 [Marivivens niveibacter]|uniref:Uncharacterized protein n=2 Tax=Marivivens niveibacter TaxID=1930667 RepID=A0A251WX56_9RHOB|nr:hypothetical protein BVC71_09410 [Marivivens niveibacter]